MNTISISYALKWRFKNNYNYQITPCKKIINIKRGNIIKCVINGGSVGWWIAGDFIPKSKINENVELIPIKEKLPF